MRGRQPTAAQRKRARTEPDASACGGSRNITLPARRTHLRRATRRLRDETLAIGKMLEKTMMEKHGPAALQQHYMVMDTICDATQARP
jgi:4-hydroxy-3-methylbut-2-enyl diphosphate reductase